MPNKHQYGIPTIPEDLYNIPKTTNPLGTEGIFAYVSDKIEYVPYKGILVYIQDATYPKKGFPMPESVAAINIIKLLIKEAIKHPALLLFSRKDTLIMSFNNLFLKVFQQYSLKDIYLCPLSYNFSQLLSSILKEIKVSPPLAETFSYNVAHIFEYDDAYRYRFQDVISEVYYEDLKKNPRKEIKRLLEIMSIRSPEGDGVGQTVDEKIKKIINPLLYLLLIPKYKKVFTSVITPEIIQGMKYDEADRYWAYQKGDDYKFGGMDYETRTKGLQIPQAVKVDY